MRLSAFVALATCVSSITGAAIVARDDTDIDIDTLLAQAQEVTKQTLESNAAKRTTGSSCTLKNISIRREWYVVTLNTMKLVLTHIYFKGFSLQRTA